MKRFPETLRPALDRYFARKATLDDLLALAAEECQDAIGSLEPSPPPHDAWHAGCAALRALSFILQAQAKSQEARDSVIDEAIAFVLEAAGIWRGVERTMAWEEGRSACVMRARALESVANDMQSLKTQAHRVGK